MVALQIHHALRRPRRVVAWYDRGRCVQPVEQRLGLFEIWGVEALSKLVIDGRKEVGRLLSFVEAVACCCSSQINRHVY
ncbi:MAG TPA: hypothetical protein DDW26_02160 [Rhizobiales bacterium]|nr:hypothetical protein [Hyphomicrobiales bacterium]